ncbi:MAG: site-2 protease family protein [Salibacteraceae bacterium]
MEAGEETEEVFYPEKPEERKKNNPIIQSAASLILFVGAYYLFFDTDLSFIYVLLVVLFIHEMGHFIAMKAFNYQDVKMFFIPLMGAMVTGQKRQISQVQQSIILLAGPVPGLIIGLVMLYLAGRWDDNTMSVTASMFLFINGFNLLPITPMDGGRLIGTLFFSSKDIVQMIFMAISAIAMAVIAVYLKAYLLLILPAFLALQAMGLLRHQKIRKELDQSELDYQQPFDEMSNETYWRVREVLVRSISTLKDVPGKPYRISAKAQQIIAHVKAISMPPPIKAITWKSKLAFLLVWVFFIVMPLLMAAWIYSWAQSL